MQGTSGITNIPAIIEELTKDEAIVQMVDSNIHREHILPSEKAFAYKMKSEALKHQGKTSWPSWPQSQEQMNRSQKP